MIYINLSTALVVITLLLVSEQDTSGLGHTKSVRFADKVRIGVLPGILIAVLHIFFTVTFRDGFDFWDTLGCLFLVVLYVAFLFLVEPVISSLGKEKAGQKATEQKPMERRPSMRSQMRASRSGGKSGVAPAYSELV